MTEAGRFTTGEDLVAGVLQGLVPRHIRMFAAQGLLPISREALLRLQLLLSADPDPELAERASEAVREIEERVIVDLVAEGHLEPVELDLLIRLRSEESVWERVARSPKVSDETLRVLACYGGPTVQDILITNQVRVLGCLDLLEDLRSNPQATQVVLRRVREFEEEFIEKAALAEGELEEPEPGPSLEEARAALTAIGGRIPREDELAPPVTDDEVATLAQQAARDGRSSFARILLLTIHGKIMLALKGTKEERAILVNSRNRLVQSAVLSSPKLSMQEVETFASSRSMPDEVIRIIATNPRWQKRYAVINALASNPKTPVRIALHLLTRLNVRDIKRMARDRNINPVVRRQAELLNQQRR